MGRTKKDPSLPMQIAETGRDYRKTAKGPATKAVLAFIVLPIAFRFCVDARLDAGRPANATQVPPNPWLQKNEEAMAIQSDRELAAASN